MSSTPTAPPLPGPVIHTAKRVDVVELSGRIVFTYRCCDDPRTDSPITIGNAAAGPNDLHVLGQAEIQRLCGIHAANIESRHEAKLGVEKHLEQQRVLHVSSPVSMTDAAGGSHHCAIVRVEHVADEIVRVVYSCDGAAADDHYSALIDHIQWHTPGEIDQICLEHMAEAARLCASRAAAGAVIQQPAQ